MEAGGGDDAASVMAARRVVLAREDIRRVGALIIEPARRLVRHRDGRSVLLEPRSMQVLIALMKADGAILSRDDLIQSCWEGRIVGDDSISSVVYRLRRDLRELGAGVLEVETITKVGFRLLRSDEVEPPLADKPKVATPEISGAPPPSRWLRGRGRTVLLVASVLTLAALAGWRVIANRAPEERPLAISPVAVVGGGIGPNLPAAFGDAFRSTLTEVGVPIAARESDLRLSTALRRSGPAVEVTTRLDDLKSGRTLWNQSRSVATPGDHALAGEANRAARVVKCALPALDAGAPARIIALTFRTCEVDDSGVSLDRARELRTAAPHYAFAQIAFAASASAVLSHPRADENAVRREGQEAAERAIMLQPGLADGYVWRALLTPFQDAPERERMLREALAKPSGYCACAAAFLGDFLAQSGRLKEALELYQQSYDRNQIAPLALYRLIRGLDYVGQHARAEALLDRLEAMHGPRADLRWAHALYLEHGPRTAGRKPYTDAALEQAAAAAMPAIEAGDAGARSRASALLRVVPVTRDNEFPLAALLSEVGDSAGAMAVVETSRRAGDSFAGPGRYPGTTSALLWDPRLTAVWRDPGFPDYLKRAGYFAYWRVTHSAPDVCRTAFAPSFCILR